MTTCTSAQTAANAAAKGTGAQADAFNAAFGVTTNFASVAVVNNQGQTVSSGSSSSGTKTTTGSNTGTNTGSKSSTSSSSANNGNSAASNEQSATSMFD